MTEWKCPNCGEEINCDTNKTIVTCPNCSKKYSVKEMVHNHKCRYIYTMITVVSCIIGLIALAYVVANGNVVPEESNEKLFRIIFGIMFLMFGSTIWANRKRIKYKESREHKASRGKRDIVKSVFYVLMFLGITFVSESLIGISMESAFFVSLLVLAAGFIISNVYEKYEATPKTDDLAETIVSLIKSKHEIKRIEFYSDKVIFDGAEVHNLEKLGYIKSLSVNEIMDCVCKINLLLNRVYNVEELGKVYGPIDSGRYETEIVEPLYGKPYAVTRKVIYEGGFAVNGYALSLNGKKTKSQIQKKWETDHLKNKSVLIGLLLLSLIILGAVIGIISS